MKKDCIKQMLNWKLPMTFLLTAFMAISPLCTAPVSAAKASDDQAQVISFQENYVNPLYAKVIKETDIVKAKVRTQSLGNVAIRDFDELSEEGYQLFNSSFTTVEEVGAYLRGEMKERNEDVCFTIVLDQDDDLGDLIRNAFDIAMEHTGVPTEGDYLAFQLAGWGNSASGSISGGKVTWTVELTLRYYTTKAQEEELDEAVKALLDSLELDGKNNYQKLCAIYDYMSKNIKYDYDNLEDDSYTLKYSAYAALINKKAVCQGYSNLLYRLLLEAGIDSRIVAGIGNGGGHAWNIVQMLDKYYNVDVTWDASYTQSGHYHSWFMQCEANFKDHERNEEFQTEAFHAKYPMGEADYVYDENDFVTQQPEKQELVGKVTIDGTLKCGETLTALVSEDNNTGVLSYQWKRGTEEIEGATSSSYQTVADDIGQILTCVVSSSEETGSISGETSGVIKKAESQGTETGLKGDCNGDGAVNRMDRIYLARALANWDGFDMPDASIADFTDDDKVNRADRIYLARALARWDGYVLE